jgi:UDP-2,4-diacetamido-2,4,6-trideoxy-beta-L-altropyranose hydrolase
MRIVFRVDSGAQMGSGHLMRCLTLANELRQSGANISFVSRLHSGHLIDKLETAGYFVYKLAAPLGKKDNSKGYEAWLGVSVAQDMNETLGMLKGQIYDWMVVDHYALDKTWESALRVNAKKIMVIDDLADRSHDCDLLLDQNYFGQHLEARYKQLVSEACKCLLGPKYAMLQPEYKAFREALSEHKGAIDRVLVFFGASDLSDNTSKVLDALGQDKLSHLDVDVVAGINHPNLENIVRLVEKRPNTFFYQDVPSLAGLMASADLIVGAGGATTWERMCLGRPALIVSVAENQKQHAYILEKEGYQALLPVEELASVNDWFHGIEKIIKEKITIMKLAEKSKRLVDGLGCNRIVEVLLSAQSAGRVENA